MEKHKEIEIIQSSMNAIRSEVNSRIDSELKLGQMTITGIAAIIVLSEDVRVERFLQILPLLAMVLIRFWLRSELSMFRVAYRLMKGEMKINELAGTSLLEYEISIWEGRRHWFRRVLWFRVLMMLVILVGSWWLVDVLSGLSGSSRIQGMKEAVYLSVTVVWLSLVALLYGECRLFFKENPN